MPEKSSDIVQTIHNLKTVVLFHEYFKDYSSGGGGALQLGWHFGLAGLAAHQPPSKVVKYWQFVMHPLNLTHMCNVSFGVPS